MIVPTMTDEQMRSEVRKDLAPIIRKYDDYSKAYRRKVLKTKAHKFPIVTEAEFISPRNNKWLLYWLSNNKREFEGKEKRKFVCIAHDFKGRKSAYEFNIRAGDIMIFRFSAHFFDRYKQRMKLTEKGNDVIRTYFRRNKRYLIGAETFLFSKGKKYEAVILTEEGACLGVLQDEVILVATFIPIEYFSKAQKEFYSHFEEHAILSWQTMGELRQGLLDAGVRPFARLITL